MANKRNGLLRFARFIVWALFLCVEINAIDDFSGDMPYLKAMVELPSNLENITNSSSKHHTANTTMSMGKTNETTTPRATNSTWVFSTTSLTNQTTNTTMSTRQTNETTTHRATTRVFPTKWSTEQPSTLKATSGSTTGSTTAAMAAETTTQNRTDVYTTTMGISEDKQMTELKTKLNGYKIATICLAAILGIVFLIILIYFSARSTTGRGDITSLPSTPPQDEENFPQTEEFKPVRLSSYFPHADKNPLKFDLNENGDVEERKVTTFLTKKRQSLEDATGSQDKILHTSEL